MGRILGFLVTTGPPKVPLSLCHLLRASGYMLIYKCSRNYVRQRSLGLNMMLPVDLTQHQKLVSHIVLFFLYEDHVCCCPTSRFM